MKRTLTSGLILVLFVGTSAAATTTGVDLEQGIALYWSGEYAETIEVLSRARLGELRSDEKVECLKYLAFSHVAVGDNDTARRVFVKLLASDPRHILDESLVSPKIVEQFELSRTELIEGWFQEGKASYFEKNYAATRRTMNRILALDANHALAKEYGQLAAEQEVIIAKAAALEQPRQPPPKKVAPPEPDNRIYRQTGQITPPVLIERVDPKYPASARRAGEQGTAVITLVVGLDGSVADVKIIRRVSPELDKAALDAVRQWRYRPAQLNGRAVAVYSVVNLAFQLDR